MKTENQKIKNLIQSEKERQLSGIELIASENFVSNDVLEAAGSILTNKYAEGYPSARYYGGCEYIDSIEQLAIDRLKTIFNAEHANVQPHCGSSANIAVYLSVLKPGDKMLGMKLDQGGHLTHGHPLNFSGNHFEVIGYGVDPETELIDYEQLEKIALLEKPKLIIAGASAYPRQIDFQKIGEIAKKVGAYYLVDMAHIAGLVATNHHQSPVPYADFVTMTTHKTLRGPRGGAILCKKEFAKKIDMAIFPGIQGGPLEHIIAAKAIAFGEAMQPNFTTYIDQVIKNTSTLATKLSDYGYRIVSGGTDNHLALIDLTGLGITGLEAEQILDSVNITVNKNTIPNDPLSPRITSGIRIGCAAITTRGLVESDINFIATWINGALKNRDNQAKLKIIKQEVTSHMQKFPLYK